MRIDMQEQSIQEVDKMKKVLKKMIIFVIHVVFLLQLNLQAEASDGVGEKIEKYLVYEITEEGTVTIENFDEEIGGDLVIPEQIDGYPVTSIDDYAFSYCGELTSIVIPESVTVIEDYAFKECSSVKSINIPKEIDTLGKGVFQDCSSLTRIVVPDTIERIEASTFYGCKGLTEIVLPKNLKSIGSEAFRVCSSITELDIPESVTVIENNAFNACKNLKELVLPDGLEEISYNLFYNCFELEHVVIPDSVTIIGGDAFYSCTKLETIIIPDSVTDLRSYAFEKSGLTEITLPGSVGKINSRTFWFCDKLQKVTLEEGIISLESEAFSDCISLEELILPEGLEVINDAVVSGCRELRIIDVPASVTTIGETAFINSSKKYDGNIKIGCYKGSYAEQYAIENDEKYYLIDGTEKDNTIRGKVSDNFTWKIDKINDKLYISCQGDMPDFERTHMPWWDYEKYVWHVEIEEGCTRVGGYAFDQMSSIIEVVLPKGMKEIGDAAFQACRRLNSINIPDTLEIVGRYAFNACACTEMVFPDSVSEIRENALVNMDSLERIYIYRKDCVIENQFANVNENLEIYGYPGSTAESLALKYGLAFKELQEKELEEILGENVSLSYKKATYNGKKKSPKIVAIDSAGKKLVEGKDYNLTYSSEERTEVGRYFVTVTFCGDYTGTYKRYYTIVPKAPSASVAAIYGYDDVKFSWSKSKGATGYFVYYKKASAAEYTYLGRTKNRYMKKENLEDGVKYTFKVVPYYEHDGVRYKGLKNSTSEVYTLKKVQLTGVSKVNSKKIQLKWKKVNGCTGYEISKSTKKDSSNVICSQKETKITINATKGKTYYYKVRAYYITESGKRIRGPWSTVKAYTLK